MSQIVKIENFAVPSYLQNAQSAVMSNALAGVSGGSQHPRISIRASRFRLVEEGVETVLDSLNLDTVVVGSNVISKQFYAGKYDPDNTTAPDCFSNDGIAPDPASTAPQCDNCAACPMNAWGSAKGPSGADSKACNDLKRLAVVSADDIEGTVYELQVTPSALKPFNAYARQLSQRRIPIEAAITRISFDPEASYPKLLFSFAGVINEDAYRAAQEVTQLPIIADITRTNGAMAALPAPKQQTAPKLAAPKAAPKAPPKAAPAPIVTEEEAEEEAVMVDEVAPPAKKGGFGKSAAPTVTVAKGGKGRPVVAKTPSNEPTEAAADAMLADFEADLNAFAAE